MSQLICHVYHGIPYCTRAVLSIIRFLISKIASLSGVYSVSVSVANTVTLETVVNMPKRRSPQKPLDERAARSKKRQVLTDAIAAEAAATRAARIAAAADAKAAAPSAPHMPRTVQAWGMTCSSGLQCCA